MDFQCCEDVEAEPVRGRFYVQAMRDGNVYMEQIPKRKRNKPIFRDDNCSLSHGKDGRYYFFFSLPEQLVDASTSRCRNSWWMSCRRNWCARRVPSHRR